MRLVQLFALALSLVAIAALADEPLDTDRLIAMIRSGEVEAVEAGFDFAHAARVDGTLSLADRRAVFLPFSSCGPATVGFASDWTEGFRSLPSQKWPRGCTAEYGQSSSG